MRVRSWSAVIAGAVALSALGAAAQGFVPLAPRGPIEHVLAPPAATRTAAPPTLRETGLYADWSTKTVAPDNLAFSPQYPLWTDGATKKRWISMPEGSWIDGSDPDRWVFPIGTRVWKEFAFGRRVETRYMERVTGGWLYATYLWNESGTEARLAPERGAMVEVGADEAAHAVPSVAECRACHDTGGAPVLGFSALQLSPDRDPNALHADPPREGDVDLAALVASGRLRGLAERLVESPPRIDAASPTERSALGYLHGNCSSCHRASGPLAGLGLSLEQLTGGEEAGARRSTVGVSSGFRPPGFGEQAVRVAPGHPERSVLFARLSSREPAVQMPPIGTHRVDEDAVRLLGIWIRELGESSPR